MEKICVILTGGTICSLPDASGKNQSNAAKTGTRLTEYFLKQSRSRFQREVSFDIKALKPDILSENMTVGVLGDILKIFREIDPAAYKGVIVLHGTDTLAYTSAFLSLALAGIGIPVCMVSAQLRLGAVVNGAWIPEEKTNGYENFRVAVELIMNGIAPNVYAVYRNEAEGNFAKGAFLVHYGAHLLQCPNGSNNFHSRDEMPIPDIKNARLAGKEFETEDCLYQRIGKIRDSVLFLSPYTGLNYSRIRLGGIRAVVHGTYHSESVCIGRPMKMYRAEASGAYALSQITRADRPYSILSLLSRCRQRGIPVLLAPCNAEEAGYGTTHNACMGGAHPLPCITAEAAYAKALVATALGLEGEALLVFMSKNINFEA